LIVSLSSRVSICFYPWLLLVVRVPVDTPFFGSQGSRGYPSSLV
jgi:hypothetical protein